MPSTKQILDSIKKTHPELVVSILSLPEATWKDILGDDWKEVSAGEARKRLTELTRVVISRETEDKRSPQWIKTRKTHLKKFPECAACGNKNPSVLNVHHIQPYNLFPERELDPKNLITLCESSDVFLGQNDHILFGHLMDWKESNPRVVQVAKEVRKMADKLRKEQACTK